MACDPNFSQVTLLLHCDGTNGSTTFTDASNFLNTVTTVGAAVVDTSEPQFGTGAMNLTTTLGQNGVTVPTFPNSILDLGYYEDWTFEFSFNLSALPVGNEIIAGDYAATGPWYIYYQPTGGGNAFITATLSLAGGGTTIFSTPSFVAATGVWHSVALVHSGNEFTIYLDGAVGGGSIVAGGLLTSTGTFTIGGNASTGNSLQGELDEIRVTQGFARYTASYTPATAAFGAACPVPPGVSSYSNLVNDEFVCGAYFGGVLNLVEFVYMPTREPFLEGATNLIINRYKQEPADVRQRGVDYTFFLVPGEILKTVSVAGISAQGVLQAATNPLVTPLVVSNLLIDPATGTKFAYTVSGGQDGIEYTVQFSTTTNVQTSTVEEIFSINVLVESAFP